MKIGKHQTVLVVDFGSQYSQLIARRVREANVYCELIPWDAPAEQFAERAPVGFILSGGPASVYEPKAPYIADHILQSGRPILGICYGMQALAHQLGGQVAYSDRSASTVPPKSPSPSPIIYGPACRRRSMLG